MIQPTDFPLPSEETITIPIPAPLILIDRDGDVWRPAGRSETGDLLLACDLPADPDDRGEGESRPWTLPKVEARFGPLTEVAA